MVLLLKQWKSRSSPGFETGASKNPFPMLKMPLSSYLAAAFLFGVTGDAGWSSPVARQAHNLKVAGSNPAPATNNSAAFGRLFCWLSLRSVIIRPLAMVGDVEPLALRVPRMPQRHDQLHDTEAHRRPCGRPGDGHSNRSDLPQQ